MADIIDLDFYRKFRVVLPVYTPEEEKAPEKQKASDQMVHPPSKQRCKRRFKATRPYTSQSSSQGEKDLV